MRDMGACNYYENRKHPKTVRGEKNASCALHGIM